MSILFTKRIPRPYRYYHQGAASTFHKYKGKGILLFSGLDTYEELNIANKIKDRKIPTAILPMPLMPEQVLLTVGRQNNLFIKNNPIPLERIGAVWYLSGIDRPMHKNEDIALHNFDLEEWKVAVSILFTQLSATWVNNPSHSVLMRTRMLKLANQVGFDTPETIVTNDSNAISTFWKENGDCILKRVGHSFPSLPTGEILCLYNRRLEAKDLINDNLKKCPVLVQKLIEKKFEYRIYIIGKEIVAFRFKANDKIDWRENGAFNISWEHFQIDNITGSRIHRFVEILNINYAAIDLIEDLKGNLYFLEINTNGTHEFIDHLVNPSISERIAHLLISFLN
jgi:glutathione synthase/RimK-type ligase-like ATP-grasp enzyme